MRILFSNVHAVMTYETCCKNHESIWGVSGVMSGRHLGVYPGVYLEAIWGISGGHLAKVSGRDLGVYLKVYLESIWGSIWMS